MRLSWPLTGRSEEMRRIDGALSDPDSSGIVICGAAGVGKSRIAREALDSAASRATEGRWIVGTSSARTLPLGALASWTEPGGSDSLELVGGVIDALTSAAAGKTVIIGVDDVPLLDDLSTFVVHQIIQRHTAKVLLTIRDGEPIPLATQELWKGGNFSRLGLQPLSRDETIALLSATLGGAVEPPTADRLWQLTRGNALYLRNIVDQEFAHSRLVEKQGYWRWTGDAVMPPGLVELIESRIGALPTAVSDVIDVLAVGEPLELEALTAIAGPAAVEEADMRGLIVLDGVEGRVEAGLAHPLYGEIRRERAAPTRLRRLRGLVAAQLTEAGDDDIRTVVRRATLSLDSDLEPDADLLVRAAQGATWLADLALADRLADAAIRAGAGAEANFVRAHALTWLSRGQEADAVLAATPRNDLTDADWGRMVFLRAQNMLFTLRDPAGAKKLIDDASHSASPRTRGSVDAILTVYWSLTGAPEKACRHAKGLEFDDLPAIVGAGTAMALSVATGDAGRTAESMAAANTAYAMAQRSYDAAQMRFVIADGHIGALLQSGRVAEADQVVERLDRQAADLPGAQLLSNALAGMVAAGAGHPERACALLAPAVEALSADTVGWGYRYRLQHTIALGMRGLADEAGDALAALEEQRHPSWRYLDYEYAIAQAWVAASRGVVSDATTTVLTAAKSAGGNGQFAPEVMCLQTATQFGEGSTAPRLAELAAIVEGPRAGLAARFADALQACDGAELAAVSAEFERMGDRIAAVDAAAHAAIAYRRKGLRGSALGCSTRAEALAEQCGGARTPALRQAIEPLPLTDREREIVMLIGEGLSNKQIAERLTVSVRTVESHIYRAMERTGTTSRAELAALLPRPV